MIDGTDKRWHITSSNSNPIYPPVTVFEFVASGIFTGPQEQPTSRPLCRPAAQRKSRSTTAPSPRPTFVRCPSIDLCSSRPSPLSSRLKPCCRRHKCAPLNSCHSNVTHDVHDTSPVRPLFGTTFWRTRIFSYIRARDPFSYALLSSFSPRPAARFSSLSSFYLSHRTQDDTLQPCARRRAFSHNSLHCFLYGHRTFSLTSPCGSVAGKTNFHSFFFSSLPFRSPLHSILYSTPSPGLGQGRRPLGTLSVQYTTLFPSSRSRTVVASSPHFTPC